MSNTEHGRTAILLIHCPDQPGIIAAVTEFITANGGNIIYLDQHTDRVENVFFMRVEWDIENFVIPADRIGEYFDTLHGRRFEMYFRIYFSDYTPRMAIFVSKMSHCLYDLMARYTAGEWKAEVPLIVSNHEDMRHVAEIFGIPYVYMPVTKENREEQALRTLDILKENRVDFLVLARYMQIISENIIEAYPNRIINIHHSFLPAFVGAKPYHAAYERGVKLIGATSHYVTAELDAGPIIGQDIARISHKDTVDRLVRKGQDLEKIVLSKAVEKHLQRKILTYKNKTVVF